MNQTQIIEALATLKHPGQSTVIAGVTVKRQAFRYVINGEFAYSVEDAAQMILS